MLLRPGVLKHAIAFLSFWLLRSPETKQRGKPSRFLGFRQHIALKLSRVSTYANARIVLALAEHHRSTREENRYKNRHSRRSRSGHFRLSTEFPSSPCQECLGRTWPPCTRGPLSEIVRPARFWASSQTSYGNRQSFESSHLTRRRREARTLRAPLSRARVCPRWRTG
jgi:hypothetical protein